MRRASTAGARRLVFVVLWLAATVYLTAQLLRGHHDFSTGTLPAISIMLACSAALIWWLPGPRPQAQPGEAPTQRLRFGLLASGLLVTLMLLRDVVGPRLLFGLPLAALAVLVALRPLVVRRDVVVLRRPGHRRRRRRSAHDHGQVLAVALGGAADRPDRTVPAGRFCPPAAPWPAATGRRPQPLPDRGLARGAARRGAWASPWVCPGRCSTR